MTLNLPPFLPPILVTLAAGHFPEGDEDVMGGLAEAAWEHAKEQLNELADFQAARVAGFSESVAGESGRAAAEAMLGAEQNLRELMELFESLAQQLKSGARDIEFEKLVVIFTLRILAVQLTLAVAFPGGALVALARWITAKKTIQSVYLQLLARLAVNGADFLGSQPLLSILVRGGGAGALQGGGADLAAQYVQIGAETREIVDRRQLAVSTASGFAGGVAGDVAARWVQPLAHRLGDLAEAAVGRRTRWMVELAVPAGAGGAAGAVAGAGAAVLMVGGDFGDIDLALTMFQGAGGGLIGAAGYALRPPTAAVPGPFAAVVPGRVDQGSSPLRRLGSETALAPSHGDSGAAAGPDVHVRAAEPAPPHAIPGLDRVPAALVSHGVSVVIPAYSPPSADIGTTTESPRAAAARAEGPPIHEFPAATPNTAAAADPPPAVGREEAAPPPVRQTTIGAEPRDFGTVEPVRDGPGGRPAGAEVADTTTTEFDVPSPQAPEPLLVPATPPEPPISGSPAMRPESSPEVHPARQPGERDPLTPETGDIAPAGGDAPLLPGGAVEPPNQPPRAAPAAARANPGRAAEFAAKHDTTKESPRTATTPETRIAPAPAVFAPQENAHARTGRPGGSAVTAPDHTDLPPAADRGTADTAASNDVSAPGEVAPGATSRASEQHGLQPRDTHAPGYDEPVDQANAEVGRSFDELVTDPGVAPADQYAPLADIAHLAAVQEALRGPDGRPFVHADPSVNRYGQLINDGGITKPGRSNNCVQLAMDALLSYYGRPAVGRARIEDGSDDSFLGERYGGERLEVWTGRSFRRPADAETADAQFSGVHAEVAGMRPGAAAVVGVQWRTPGTEMDPARTDGHILTVVYPEGAAGPVWWDPQSGETWHSPPSYWITHSDDLLYIPITAEQGAALAVAASPDAFRYDPGPVVTTGVPRLPGTAAVGHSPEFFALAAGAPRPEPGSLPAPTSYPPNATGFTRWLRDTAARFGDEGRSAAPAGMGPEAAEPPGTHRAKESSADGSAGRPAAHTSRKEIHFPAELENQNSYEITDSNVLADHPSAEVRSEWLGKWHTALDDRDRITARRAEIGRESSGAAGSFREKAAEYGIDTPVTGNSGRPYRSADDVLRLSVSKYATEFERMRSALENDEGLPAAERNRLVDEFTKLKRQSFEYHSLAVELVGASKETGMAAGVLYALDPGERPGAVLLAPHATAFDGPNVVDIASFVPASGGRPPKLVIVEAKGGKAGTLTPAGVYDRQKRDFVNAQQGSPEYLRRTLANDTNLRKLLNDPLKVLIERGISPESPEGRELARTVDELVRAHRNGTLEIEYHKVHARENGTVKAGRFNLDPGDPRRSPVEITSIGGIIRETVGRPGAPEWPGATARRALDGNGGPDHAVVQRLRDRLGDEILQSAVERFGRPGPDDVLHRLATRVDTALDNQPAVNAAPEKVAGIRDIDASKAGLVRTMLGAWLGSWSPDSGYLHDIADTVAATVAAARGIVEIDVAAHGTGNDKAARVITVIETAPGNADSRAETVWRLPPEPAAVESAAPTTAGPSPDPGAPGVVARDAQADRAEVDRQADRVRAQLRSAHPWMTADQVDSAGVMFAQTYARALADSPDPAGRVSIESTSAGHRGRGMRLTITSTLAEGRAAQLPPWHDEAASGTSAGPHHLAASDANGRTIELAAEGRTATHWFEIHYGSARQSLEEPGRFPVENPGAEGAAEPPIRYGGRSTPWSESGAGAREAAGTGDEVSTPADQGIGNTTTPWTNVPVDAPPESGAPPGDSVSSEEDAVLQAIESRSEILGLGTPAERALEAGLLIEECFLGIALIAQQTRPELLFGAREWAGYLDARVAAKRYGDQGLTVDFMIDLHCRLSQFTAPDTGGLFTEPNRKRWGVLSSPLSDREIEVIENNPRLTWLPPPLRPFGIIRYQKFPTVAAVRDELQALCDWYNSARRPPGSDPYRVAAELQREFVAIHPWDRDYNGRTSRLLMNWSLERDGLPASAVPDFDRDIVTPVDDWVIMVREGSALSAERAAKIERLGNAADPVVVFGLERERQRYREEGGELEPFTPGEEHDGAAYRALLARLRGDDMGGPTLPQARSGTI